MTKIHNLGHCKEPQAHQESPLFLDMVLPLRFIGQVVIKAGHPSHDTS